MKFGSNDQDNHSEPDTCRGDTSPTFESPLDTSKQRFRPVKNQNPNSYEMITNDDVSGNSQNYASQAGTHHDTVTETSELNISKLRN